MNSRERGEIIGQIVMWEIEHPVPVITRQLPLGIELSTQTGLLGSTRDITLPKNPNLAQRTIAYALLKTGVVSMARTSDQFMGYAFRGVNPRRAFSLGYPQKPA